VAASPIDLDALRSFVAVAESLAFGKAAERLGVSTPALTRRVQRLEAALGTALLERSTRQVALSPTGRLFLPLAQQVIHDLDAAVRTVQEDARGRAGHLTLASLPTVAAHLLPRIIRDFRVRWPEIRLRVTECRAAAVMRKLREGSVEFGFTFRAGKEIDLAFDPILTDPYCLIMPPGHALAAQDRVAWQSLKPHALITAGPRSGNMRLLEEALKGVDWRPDTTYEIEHLTTSLGLVEAGLGIAVVPQSSLPTGPHPSIVMRPLTDPVVSRTLCLFRRRNERLSTAAQRFLMIARQTGRILSNQH
jgi:DNA-binding transcriptional LysR family regulator